MAIDTRLKSEFQSDRGTYYKVSIIDTQSSTSTEYEVEAASNGFDLTYQTDTDDRFTGLIPSEVKFTFFLANPYSAAKQSILNSIRTSEYKRWQIKIESSINGSTFYLFWAGNLLNEINPESDESLPTQFSLTAICGLAALKNIPFNEDVAYDFNLSYSCYRYVFNAINTDINTDNNWGTDDRFIRTMVDWTNSQIPRNNGTDPLNNTRFKAAAYAPIDANGVRQPDTAFKVLNQICKAFGARLFLSEGIWYFIQVNTYEEMDSADQYYRDYKKANNGSTFTPDFFGTIDLNTTEDGTNIVRLAGNKFDYLGILKQAKVTYEMFGSYDLIPSTITNASGTNDAVNNSLVAWNGWYSTGLGFNTNSGIYGINDYTNTSDYVSYYMGELTLLDGQTIKINRTFNRSIDESSADWGITTNSSILFYHRLKLVGSSSTVYARATYSVNGLAQWTSNDVWGNAPDYNVPFTFFGDTGSAFSLFNPLPDNSNDLGSFVLNFNTAEVPFSGDLYFECYAQTYYDYGNSSNVAEDGTELTTLSDQQKLYIYSAPENSDDQIFQIYINGESTSQQLFITSQSIANGLTYDVGELQIGSGPTGANVGRLECYSGSAWDDGTNITWVAYGAGTGKAISKLLTNEILSGQNEGARVFDGSLKLLSNNVTNGYKFHNGITIDSSLFVPYQTTFIANDDTWQGEWYQIQTLDLGPELVTNGDFDTDSDWTKSSQSTISNGTARILSTDGSFQFLKQSGYTSTQGETVKVTIDIVDVQSGQLKVFFDGGANTQNIPSTVGTHTVYLVNDGTIGTLAITRVSGVTDITIDNVSVKEVLTESFDDVTEAQTLDTTNTINTNSW